MLFSSVNIKLCNEYPQIEENIVREELKRSKAFWYFLLRASIMAFVILVKIFAWKRKIC